MAEITDEGKLNLLYQIASNTKDFGSYTSKVDPNGEITYTPDPTTWPSVTPYQDPNGNQFWLPPNGQPHRYPYSISSSSGSKLVTEIQDPVLRGYIMDMFDKLQSFSKASEKMYLLIYKELLDVKKELQELKEKR